MRAPGSVPALAIRAIWLALLIVIGVIVAAGVSIGAMSTLVTLAAGRFSPEQVFSSVSPDGRFRVVATERADFPPNEFLDPSATLVVDLMDAQGDFLDQCFIGQFEYSDFNDAPTVIWETDGRVRVLDIDNTGHHLSAVLDVHAFEHPLSRREFADYRHHANVMMAITLSAGVVGTTLVVFAVLLWRARSPKALAFERTVRNIWNR